MEKLVREKSQGALRQRDWTSPRGEKLVISSVELILTDGIDTFVVEATDQLAMAISKEPLSRDAVYACQCRMDVNSWESPSSGERMFATKIRILKLHAV